MISADLRIQGFDARAFTNLVSLFAPNVVWRRERDPAVSDAPELSELPPTEREPEGSRGVDGTLVVVIGRTGKLLKAFHTVHGRVRDFRFEGWDKLEGVPERYGAKRVIVLRDGVLEQLYQRASSRMHREDDYAAQWLQIARAIREELDAGAIVVHPPVVSVPLPTSQLLRRSMDSVLPDDRAFVLAVWRGATLWTAAVLRRRGGEIDWIAGPDQLAAWTGQLGGDWRRDHRLVLRAVTANVAPVHLGVFGELRAIRRLLHSREAGAWAKAVTTRDVIVSPTPPYVAVALGADAMRRVAQKSTSLLGGLDPLGRLAPMLGYVRGRVAEVASVTQALGFNPLRVLAQFLERVDPIDESLDDALDDGEVDVLDVVDEDRFPASFVARGRRPAAHRASGDALDDAEDTDEPDDTRAQANAKHTVEPLSSEEADESGDAGPLGPQHGEAFADDARLADQALGVVEAALDLLGGALASALGDEGDAADTIDASGNADDDASGNADDDASDEAVAAREALLRGALDGALDDEGLDGALDDGALDDGALDDEGLDDALDDEGLDDASEEQLETRAPIAVPVDDDGTPLAPDALDFDPAVLGAPPHVTDFPPSSGDAWSVDDAASDERSTGDDEDDA